MQLTSSAKMIVTMRTGTEKRFIGLERCDMLMNSTTFIRHRGSNI